MGDPCFSRKGMVEQDVKGEDFQMGIGKSDGLIVLGAWKSHVHGEAARKEVPDSV